MTLPSTATLLQQQEANYKTVVQACNAVPKCVGITLWDFTDKVSHHMNHLCDHFLNLLFSSHGEI